MTLDTKDVEGNVRCSPVIRCRHINEDLIDQLLMRILPVIRIKDDILA